MVKHPDCHVVSVGGPYDTREKAEAFLPHASKMFDGYCRLTAAMPIRDRNGVWWIAVIGYDTDTTKVSPPSLAAAGYLE
jgi:hypothetical protein